MNAGKLNRRVQIQQQATTQDSFGQETQAWTTVYTAWAEVAVQTSQLIYATAEFISKVTHRITMRWTSSIVIQPNMRAIYTEQTTGVVHTFNIEALLNVDQRNRTLILLAYELAANE